MDAVDPAQFNPGGNSGDPGSSRSRRMLVMEASVKSHAPTGEDGKSKPEPTIDLEDFLPSVGPVFKSLKADTHEELDAKVQAWLAEGNKRIVTISCYHDGKYHYAMLGANPSEVPEVLINGQPYRYRGQAMVSKDGQMMVQCY